MKAVDSSVIIAAFASWHERHTTALKTLDGSIVLVEHCALETYSVLTRLPAPHRAPADVVRDFLRLRFPGVPLRLSVKAHRKFLLELPEKGITGGAVYDALVAATVAEQDLELLSCDLRAAVTYERYGVRVQFV